MNKNKDMRKKIFLNVLIGVLALTSCKDDVVTPEVEVPVQSEEALTMLEEYNMNIAAFQMVAEGKATVVEVAENGTLKFDNKAEAKFSFNENADQDIPVFGIDENGYWQYMIHGETQELKDMSGNRAAALSGLGTGVFTPKVSISKDGYWQVSFNGVEWKKLSDVIAPSLESKTAESYALFKSSSVEGKTMKVQSVVGGIEYAIQLPEDNMAEAWRRFIMNTDDNVLLDYSYAGYDHGESAPADGFAWGYTVENVSNYMTEGKTFKDALDAILQKYGMTVMPDGKNKANANARLVIYLPEGNYVLQNETDGQTTEVMFFGGNFIIKGDGPDKTKIFMKSPNYPSNPNDANATGPSFLTIKHTNSPNNYGHSPLLAKVTENSKKGDFYVTVDDASKVTVGKWIQLRLRSQNQELVKSEIGPMAWNSDWTICSLFGADEFKADGSGNITDNYKNGLKLTEFHKVKRISGNRVYFYDPIMSDVDVQFNDGNYGDWELREFKYFENVGVEDLSFVCENNKATPYYHHGENAPASISKWMYDSGFRPITFTRVVNSWIRNVVFTNISEAVTFGESANCSAYNIEINGVRGHSAVRAAGSSRVFIGGIKDISSDTRGDGQWHGSGVSKPSIGCVICNSNWGSNACFESHATQPRATLFDNCSGGLVYYHAGGAENEAPNHLRELTIWNLNVTGTVDEKNRDFATNFEWWLAGDIWWKIYPPIVVGTYGQAVTFSKEEGQLTYEESTGSKVYPESLYEAQLKRRLGTLPAWIKSLK